MSHNIQTMAYAKEIPWHGLGKYVGDRDVSAAEMMKAAGLDWNVRALDIGNVLERDAKGALVQVHSVDANGHRALVRSDNGCVLGTCKGVYRPFQNSEVFGFMDGFKADGLRYHTAGALFKGERVWALAQVNGEFQVHRRDGSVDAHAAYLLMVAGHDGGTPVILQTTDVRVVCWNTLSAALTDKSNAWRIRHTASMDGKLKAARDALTGAIDHAKSVVALGTDLDRERLERLDFVRFANALILSDSADPREARDDSARKLADLKKAGQSARAEKVVGDLLHAFDHGIGNQGQSKYDALNAVTEWIDHQRSRARRGAQTVEQLSRATESAWSGTGADRKARAVKLLQRW